MCVLYAVCPGIYVIIAAEISGAFGTEHYQANFGLYYTHYILYIVLIIPIQVSLKGSIRTIPPLYQRRYNGGISRTQIYDDPWKTLRSLKRAGVYKILIYVKVMSCHLIGNIDDDKRLTEELDRIRLTLTWHLFQKAGIGLQAMFLLSAGGAVLGLLAVLLRPERYLPYRSAASQEQSWLRSIIYQTSMK